MSKLKILVLDRLLSWQMGYEICRTHEPDHWSRIHHCNHVVRVDGILKSNMPLKSIEREMLRLHNLKGNNKKDELLKEARVGFNRAVQNNKGHTVAESGYTLPKENPIDLVVMGS